MRQPYQSADSLLLEIEKARAACVPKLWWLGQSGFLFFTGKSTILFDPYLSDALTEKYAKSDKPHERMVARVIEPHRLTGIDWITTSHNHTDHLDGETLLPLFDSNPHAKLLVGKANFDFVAERLHLNSATRKRLVSIDAGEVIFTSDFACHAVPAAHNHIERDESGFTKSLGFVVRSSGFVVYHSGDTLWHPKVQQEVAAAIDHSRLDVALLPINGNFPDRRVAGNMNGAEAAEFASILKADIAIPHHYDMFHFNSADPKHFHEACRQHSQNCRILQVGEGMELVRY